ncbi:unnamed protein product [Adineta ricciae]|uniref:CNH domain-containing protein n=1 Tax=Adineta ricciae TaxID=249248 RepID=A0A814RG17_ADIRI|nr:unnamed protein product [Adineta ricciae]
MNGELDADAKLLQDPNKLCEYFLDNIESMNRSLTDETDFLNNDIEACYEHIEKIKEKFLKKIEEFSKNLEDIRRQNEELSGANKNLLDNASSKISELFESQRYTEALEEYRAYEKRFNERKRVKNEMLNFRRNEQDIDRFFSTNSPLNDLPVSSSNPVPSATNMIPAEIGDEDDEAYTSKKQKLRRKKKLDKDDLGNEDDGMKTEDTQQHLSTFGIRSNRVDKQPQATPPLTNTNTTGNNPPSTSNSTVQPRYIFSSRLGLTSSNTKQSSSNRNLSTAPCIQNSQLKPLKMKPVVLYKLEDNHFLLMTCTTNDIILFKCQCNRLDRWRLDLIERRTHSTAKLEWHDGLIISMGSIDKQQIYMFTEKAFHTFYIRSDRRGISRILPRGNDDGSDIGNYSYSSPERGIGIVHEKHMYHIFLNRKSRWTLSKNLLDTVAHLYNYDLALLFPDVERFIQFCITDRTMNFLVQLSNSSYAVVFCSANECSVIDSLQPIILPNAHQPLTICPVFISSINEYHFYINDPSTDTLHVINTDRYLYQHQVKAYAICYVRENQELLIVTENSISSIDIN